MQLRDPLETTACSRAGSGRALCPGAARSWGLIAGCWLGAGLFPSHGTSETPGDSLVLCLDHLKCFPPQVIIQHVPWVTAGWERGTWENQTKGGSGWCNSVQPGSPRSGQVGVVLGGGGGRFSYLFFFF